MLIFIISIIADFAGFVVCTCGDAAVCSPQAAKMEDGLYPRFDNGNSGGSSARDDQCNVACSFADGTRS